VLLECALHSGPSSHRRSDRAHLGSPRVMKDVHAGYNESSGKSEQTATEPRRY
jgi:hypothetical protein